MSLTHFFAAITLLLTTSSLYAQAWQVSGFLDPARQSTAENPEDPSFGKSVDQRRVVLSVADENGRSITGLKPNSFQGFVQSCDEISCRFFDLSIVMLQQSPNFREERPGLYVINFRAQKTIQSGPVFIKVFRRFTPSEIVTRTISNTQKAQVILH